MIVSGEGSKERSERIVDREIVIPWLKFLWETYRTVLDTLRYMSKLELLYKSTAEQAFQFCLTHKRVTEFRRLNELLKSHMTFLKTNSAAQLDNPDSFQIQLEIRLMQLNTAAAMEQWQEAFKTVEEINGMVAPPKRTPPIEMMILYYEKLAKIFWVSENYIFHAHAMAKYHQLLAEVKSGKETESSDKHDSKIPLPTVNETELSTQVFLAALSMPVAPGVSQHRSVQLKASRQHVPLAVSYALEKQQSLNVDVATDHLLSESESNLQERLARASQMYGFSDLEADRDAVLRDFIGRDQLVTVNPEFAELYEMLETKFQPLKLGKAIQAKIAALEANPAFKPYSKTITQLAFLRIVQQLGSVYQTLKLQRLFELIPFLTTEMIERWTIKAIRERYIEAKLDHKHGFIIFQTSLAGAMQAANPGSNSLSGVPAGTCSSFESQRMRHQLVHVAQNLSLAVNVVLAPNREARQAQKKQVFAAVVSEMEGERARILKRRDIIERTNQEREKRIMAAAKDRVLREKASKEKLALEEKERQEQKRIAAAEKIAAAKKAELESQQKTALMGKLQEAAAKQGTSLDSRATGKLMQGAMDTQSFIDSQVKLLVQSQQRTESKLRELVEKADHLARARREAEIPLMQAAVHEREQKEAGQMQTIRDKKTEEARKAYEKMVADKKRLTRVQDARKALETRVLAEREAAWRKADAERKTKDEAAAKKREEERAKQEADAERKRVESERKAEETRAKKEKDDAERAAADKVAAERAPESKSTPSGSAAAATTGGDAEPKLNWAQRRALEAGGSIQRPGSGGGSAPSAGAYRPPGASGGGGSSYRPPGARGTTTSDSPSASNDKDNDNDGDGEDDGSWKSQGRGRPSSGTGGGSSYASGGSGTGSGTGTGNTGSSAQGGSAYKPPGRRGGDRW
jgi:translation initiation factor 3 subunit A